MYNIRSMETCRNLTKNYRVIAILEHKRIFFFLHIFTYVFKIGENAFYTMRNLVFVGFGVWTGVPSYVRTKIIVYINKIP